jgi:hypothetical protein
MEAVRDFEKKVDMNMQYDIDARKNTKNSINTNNFDEYSNKCVPAAVKSIDKGNRRQMKLKIQDAQRASLRIAFYNRIRQK